MKKTLAVLATLPLFTLAACGGGADEGSSGDGTTSVIASFYPLAFVAEQVGGSYVSVDSLTSPGVEAHDLELKPKQVGALQDAELVLYQEHFQTAVDEAVEQADRDPESTIDVAALVDLLPAGGEDEHDHADEGHDHAEDEAHAEEDHDHGDEDPHTWLDPATMIALTGEVEARLSRVDPDHADDFRANAERLVTELTDIDTAFSTGLETCKTRTIVTSHAAFAYLAARYDLEQVAIAGVDPTNEPSPSQLADITELVRDQGITTIFTEELVSPAIADTIARETGATTATLDPIEGLSDDTAGETYLTLMRKNLANLQKANSCS